MVKSSVCVFNQMVASINSYNVSFTEPWLGGKKRNSLTFSLYKSKFTNGYDYTTGQFLKERADSSYLKTLGASISLGKQLKWPDDYFSLVYTLNFTQYKLLNYPIFAGLDSGNSTNISFKIALQRNSAGPNPIFPTSGSNFLVSVQATPPYSVFNPKLMKMVASSILSIISGDSMQSGLCHLVNQWVLKRTGNLL